MRSYVAQKKDIKTLLDNPKITFVLGNFIFAPLKY